MDLSLGGVIPATFTPFHKDGTLHLDMIGPLVEKLVADQVSGLFVLGTTGESASMTAAERKAAAERFIAEAAGRLPVIVHIGHASIEEACDLAAHARAAGADGLAALPPYYHKPESVEAAVGCLERVAAAGGELPLLYYHIPQMSGVWIDPAALLEAAVDRVPTLLGIKFSNNNVTEMAACCAVANGRYTVLWGVDESLLAGLVAGADGGIGSSYNYATPLYHDVLASRDGAPMQRAQVAQERSRLLLGLLNGRGGLPAAKALMAAVGVDCGPTRLPLQAFDTQAREALITELEQLGYMQWLVPAPVS